MKKKWMLWLLALVCGPASLKAAWVDVTRLGADNQGKTNVAALVNREIEKQSAAGGGTIYFPSGTYLTSSLVLRDNITLYLEAGATLRFSDRFDDYLPFVEMRHEGVMMKSFQPLVYAVDARNISIKGEGTLDGSGKAWWDEFMRLIQLERQGKPATNRYQSLFEQANDMEQLKAETNEDWHRTLGRRFFRPPFLHFIRCKDIRIEGVRIINSPFWTVNPEFCDNLRISGITIENPLSPNTDGINPESCRNVHISDCHISVGDDCITIKSGRDLQARRLNVPCENIVITNCTMLKGHGGVVIGSEMSGGVKKVTISNCVFDGTERGIRIKSTRGRGGVVENIRVSNIMMTDIEREAIVLNLKYSKMPAEPLSERTPRFRNIHISGVTVEGVKTPIKLVGLEEAPIAEVVLRDIHIEGAKEASMIEHTAGVRMEDVWVNGKALR